MLAPICKCSHCETIFEFRDKKDIIDCPYCNEPLKVLFYCHDNDVEDLEEDDYFVLDDEDYTFLKKKLIKQDTYAALGVLAGVFILCIVICMVSTLFPIKQKTVDLPFYYEGCECIDTVELHNLDSNHVYKVDATLVNKKDNSILMTETFYVDGNGNLITEEEYNARKEEDI